MSRGAHPPFSRAFLSPDPRNASSGMTTACGENIGQPRTACEGRGRLMRRKHVRQLLRAHHAGGSQRWIETLVRLAILHKNHKAISKGLLPVGNTHCSQKCDSPPQPRVCVVAKQKIGCKTLCDVQALIEEVENYWYPSKSRTYCFEKDEGKNSPVRTRARHWSGSASVIVCP